jgi:hypothetical protein
MGFVTCRTHWGEVGWVREEDPPAVSKEIMELELALKRKTKCV